MKLNDLTKDYYIKRNSLVQNYYKLPQDEQQVEGKKIWTKIRSIDKKIQSLKIDYVKSHPKTYTSVINLAYLKESLPKDTVQAIFDRYSPEIKNSKHAKIVKVFLNENIAKVGETYHNFEALTQKGETIKFSEIRENYTLLDFAIADCVPCVKSVKELKELNKIYGDSLQIISFSGDANKEVWLQSLKRDSISWLSVWDGEGRYSETSIKYGVSGYPSFVLIAPNGEIVDMWSGYSNGFIEKKLSKIL